MKINDIQYKDAGSAEVEEVFPRKDWKWNIQS